MDKLGAGEIKIKEGYQPKIETCFSLKEYEAIVKDGYITISKKEDN